jgi:hypothetical protein
MPNGRSGGFVIEKADLKNLVKTIPDATVIARILSSSAEPRPLDAVETSRLVGECLNDRIAVEEQHHDCYIIHLTNEPENIWLMVGPMAPIFLELRERHRRWTTEHPDWHGWIAF